MTGLEHVSPLEALRFAKGLSQIEAAKQIGITSRSLRGLEHGDHEPVGETIFKLARFYEIDPAELLNEVREWRGGRRTQAAA
jgi:transcriptional regulator with XRE-family HTH domain